MYCQSVPIHTSGCWHLLCWYWVCIIYIDACKYRLNKYHNKYHNTCQCKRKCIGMYCHTIYIPYIPLMEPIHAILANTKNTYAIHANTNEHLQIQTNTNLAVGLKNPHSGPLFFKSREYFRQYKGKQWPSLFCHFNSKAIHSYSGAHAPGQHMWQSLGPGLDSKCSKFRVQNSGSQMFISRSGSQMFMFS